MWFKKKILTKRSIQKNPKCRIDQKKMPIHRQVKTMVFIFKWGSNVWFFWAISWIFLIVSLHKSAWQMVGCGLISFVILCKLMESPAVFSIRESLLFTFVGKFFSKLTVFFSFSTEIPHSFSIHSISTEVSGWKQALSMGRDSSSQAMVYCRFACKYRCAPNMDTEVAEQRRLQIKPPPEEKTGRCRECKYNFIELSTL